MLKKPIDYHLKLKEDIVKVYGTKGLDTLARYGYFNTLYVVEVLFPLLWAKTSPEVKKGLYSEYLEGRENKITKQK